MPKRLTTEEFRRQLEREHPDLELLSEYKGNKNYVTVRCKIHGYTFEAKPNWLHCGHGCMKCYQERNGKDRLKSMDKFMKELKKNIPTTMSTIFLKLTIREEEGKSLLSVRSMENFKPHRTRCYGGETAARNVETKKKG